MNKMTALFVLLFAFGCGIKGPPQPPLPVETIQKQKYENLQNKTNNFIDANDEEAQPDKKSKKK